LEENVHLEDFEDEERAHTLALGAFPEPMIEEPAGFEHVKMLRADLRAAVDLLAARGREGYDEVRFVVQQYYNVQENRIRAQLRAKRLQTAGKPNQIITWSLDHDKANESQIASFLDYYTKVEGTGMGEWARTVVGIGPILSAGLLSEIDIERTHSSSALYSFAGLNPMQVWFSREDARKIVSEETAKSGKKVIDILPEIAARCGRKVDYLRTSNRNMKTGEVKPPTSDSIAAAIARRPYNATLKTLCWKIGKSFMMLSGNPKCFYGHLYSQFKADIIAKNERGEYAQYAAHRLTVKNYGKETATYAAYSEGKLPESQITGRARRMATKIFLCHWWEEYYERHFGVAAPLPYVFANKVRDKDTGEIRDRNPADIHPALHYIPRPGRENEDWTKRISLLPRDPRLVTDQM
jgi:hypothetical protein